MSKKGIGIIKRDTLSIIDDFFEVVMKVPHGISRSAIQKKLGTNWYTVARLMDLVEKIQQEYPLLELKRNYYPQPDGSVRQRAWIMVKSKDGIFQTLADQEKED